MSIMLQLQAPDFTLDCIEGESFRERIVNGSDYAGHWLILLFYARDFSLVCSSELTDFNLHHEDFQNRECKLLGISVDSLATHREWLETPRDQGGLGPLKFPLASDPNGHTAQAYGVHNRERQNADRGLFVIDPQGVVQHVVIHNPNVGRSAIEALRILDALQTRGLCPATWISRDEPFSLDEALKPGQVLGQYRIRHHLGKGTFGKVFAGSDLRQGREVAIKILKPDQGHTFQAVFAQARATIKLSHPNICTVHSVEETDGVIAIAMEPLSGRPLSNLLDEPLPEARVRRLAGQIASALAAAHAQNIIHGDLKPANVRVLPFDVIKIMDFNIARTFRESAPTGRGTALPSPHDSFNFEESEDDDQTTMFQAKHVTGPDEFSSISSRNTLLENDGRAFGLTGTPGYMSPEQSRGLSATPESDTFSLGLILFEMLTGTRALSEKNLVMLMLHLQDATLAVELSANVPSAFQDLLSQMLANNPKNRPAMKVVAEQLQQINKSQTASSA